MADPFLSEIRMLGFPFAPRGWAQCNGQIMAIAQNQALFSLLGTTYGGNGVQTFALPNLQGNVPIHFGAQPGGVSYSLGQIGGEANHSLSVAEVPSHSHGLQGSTTAGDQAVPNNNYLAGGGNLYTNKKGNVTLLAATVGSVGGSPHTNMQPYLPVNFCIALQGVFPSRN